MIRNAVFFIFGEIYELGQPHVENTSPLGCQMLNYHTLRPPDCHQTGDKGDGLHHLSQVIPAEQFMIHGFW